jgi:serine/threonine protein kinase
MNYFKDELTGFDSWARVFCSIESFEELTKYIFKKEGLSVQEGINNLTPGSNAVFKVDNYVIKIFAPKESSFDTEMDYHTELAVMNFAKQQGVAIPNIVAHGSVNDKYLFRYIIMEFIDGFDACDVLSNYSLIQKRKVVSQLKTILSKLNQPVENLITKQNLNVQIRRKERLNGLSKQLIEELENCANNQDLSNSVIVHGDITGENVRVNHMGELKLIDFADCMVAPSYYELPPIIFELFRYDMEYVKAFIEDEDADIFLDKLILGLSLHMFCGNIIKDFLGRLDLPLDSITGLDELRVLIKKIIGL